MGLYHKRLLFQKDGQHYGVNLFTEKKGLSLTTSVDGQTLYAPISAWTPYSVPLKVHYQGQDLYVNNEPEKLPWMNFYLLYWNGGSSSSTTSGTYRK